ncbi:O-antigen ligase family protein [Pseudomonas citronellolis]|uniref:O-antigen ligase family protein n=1 Tax=Pseudomonas citronellolis TaxID=53408 RepID=UPI000A9A141C|nr:O-antigen ligase family protein [Pseudomonas citronellolis]
MQVAKEQNGVRPFSQIQRTLLSILSILTLSLLFINLKLNNLIGSSSESNLNLFYFLLPVLFLLLPKYKSQFRSHAFSLFLILFSANAVAYLRYGFSFEAVRLIIAAMAFLSGYSLVKFYSPEKISSFFNITSLVATTIILARFLAYPGMTLDIYHGNRSALAEYPYLTAGGHNIEVTYLIFLASLCSNKKIYLTLLTLAFALSIIYMSRVGILLITLILIIGLYKRLSLAKFIMAFFFTAFCAPITLYIASPQTFERFTNIQQEVEYGDEGVGRIGLLRGALTALDRNMWGYGTGNSLNAMTNITGIVYKENNLHNIYLQILLDLGVFGFASFILFAAFVISRSIRHGFSNTYQVLATTYLLIGLIQFTGFDALGWLCLGLAYPSIASRPTKNGNYSSSGNSK